MGVIDRIHIRVKVSKNEAPWYYERKDYTTQNVTAACEFDIRFTYVLPRWKGIASNLRIIKNVLVSDDKLIISKGKVKLYSFFFSY